MHCCGKMRQRSAAAARLRRRHSPQRDPLARARHSTNLSLARNLQALVTLVEDVLADAILHGRVPKGTVAYVDLDPATRAPRCWAGRPPACELAPPGERLATPGADDESLLAPLPDAGGAGGAFSGGFGGSGDVTDGSGGEPAFVLASGGFEEEDAA